MKRIFSFICACLLLCTCTLTGFADETIESQPNTIPSEPNTNQNNGPSADDIAWMIAQNIPMDDTTVPTPSLYINEDAGSMQIICVTQPDEATSFILHELGQHYGQGNMPTQWNTDYFIDWRFDDGKWFSECAELDDALMDVLCHEMHYEKPVTQSLQFYLFDLSKYHPEQYETNCLANIVESKNNQYFIDFTKHRLEVRITVSFMLFGDGIQLPTSRSTTYFILNPETPLPAPTIDHATISTSNKALSFRLSGDSVIKLMLQNSQSLNLYVKYTINGEEYDQLTLPVNLDKYYTHPLESIELKPEDVVQLHVAYHNTDTNEISPWTTMDVTIQEKQPVASVVQPEDSVTQYETITECAICHHCSAPLNVCLYLLLATIIGAVGSVTCIILICIHKHKEKQTCLSKNSKTRK